jgi:chemotaxis protein methyltransferase CheR
MDDHQFRELLERMGLSWKGYRKVRKGVKRRLGRHMQELGCSNVRAYSHLLAKNGEARHECERLMTVSISRFFRDQRLWEVLQEEILPELARIRRKRIRAWSAGCARGEEVYSLNMVWHAVAASLPEAPELVITATDLNPAYLEQAKKGIYSHSSFKEVPEGVRSLWFREATDPQQFVVKPEAKTGITWHVHDMLSDPPGPRFDLIFLRNNLLTYYQDRLSIPAFDKAVNCLCAGGFLVLGSHESPPVEVTGLLHRTSLPFVFKKGRGGSCP